MQNAEKAHTSISKELNFISNYLPGEVSIEDNFSSLRVHKDLGEGVVYVHYLEKGLKVYDFDVTLSADLEIPIDSISAQTLQFLYCFKGSFDHQFNADDQTDTIDQFQTAVAHCDTGIHNLIKIPKKNRLVLNIILVNKNVYFEKFEGEQNEVSLQLKELLNTISKEPKYFHLGGYSLKIAEQFKLLYGIEYANNISERLSQKGRFYIVLAKQIGQFFQEINNSPNTSGLSKSELAKIYELRNIIIESPEIQHTIKSLISQCGLSPAKLQSGFKYLYQRTVSDFIRNVRLEKAVILLKTTDLTISEIVYTVGFTSRSYFCKIFKRKHQCSPKQFKQKSNS